jgi:hypothetical protein
LVRNITGKRLIVDADVRIRLGFLARFVGVVGSEHEEAKASHPPGNA